MFVEYAEQVPIIYMRTMMRGGRALTTCKYGVMLVQLIRSHEVIIDGL